MNNRRERVAKLIQKEIGNILRVEIDDPDIGFTTIMHIGLARDLKSAKVFYSVMGDEDARRRADLAIKRHAKYIKKLLNDNIQLRYAIDLNFIREDGVDHAFKIDKIIQEIHKKDTN